MISESKVTKIVCPQDGCVETIDAQFIELLISCSLFEKYKTRLRSLQDKAQIKCPKLNCLISNMIDAKKEFTVSVVLKYVIFVGNYWHNDKTCLQAVNEELGEFSKNNETRLCKNCKPIVTKTEGCPHMTCPVCKYEWCWDCGEEYLSEHAANYPKVLIRIKITARQRLRAKVRNILSKFCFIFCNVAIASIIPVVTIEFNYFSGSNFNHIPIEN